MLPLVRMLPFVMGLGILRAASLVPLAEVGQSIGQNITVTDTVRGATGVTGRGFAYLSLGDAYPRQTLSIRIPAEAKDVLELVRNSFGLTVTATGIVERVRGNVVLTVADASQIRISEPEPGDVLETTGEGPAYRQRLAATVRRLLLAGDYERLEELAASWRHPLARNADGLAKLGSFYEGCEPLRVTEASAREFSARLEAWRAARPGAIEPWIAAASLEVALGWLARGSGFAHTVTEEGWKLLRERLDRAEGFLMEARKTGGMCPHWFVVMQRVALGQGWERARYEMLFNEAVAYEPAYEALYMLKAYWLLPRWYGGLGEWERFTSEVARTRDPALAARIPWSLAGVHTNIFRETGVDWQFVRAGFEQLLAATPDSARNRSAFALFAGMAEDRATCGRELAALGDRVDMDLWVSWANVEFAKAWSAGGDAPAPVLFGLVEKER